MSRRNRRNKRRWPNETWDEYQRRRQTHRDLQQDTWRRSGPADGPVAQGTSLVTINSSLYERLDRMLGWVEFPEMYRYDAVWLGQYLAAYNEHNEMVPVVVELVAELLEDAGTVITFLGDQALVR